ncbi:MAG: DUF3379 family protein [Pseudohongiellaceae bacterium]
MDDLEFRRRIFADPYDTDQALLTSASGNPTHQKLLDDVRVLDGRLQELVQSTPIPDSLREKLESVLDTTTAEAIDSVQGAPRLRQFAIAASLVVAAGAAFSVFKPSGNPTAEELAFGQQALSHVYTEAALSFAGGAPLELQQVNTIIGELGARVHDTDAMRGLHISFAKPCAVTPPIHSAHLVMEDEQGQVSVILSNSSPVSREFTFGDNRFSTTVIPMGEGALILIGGKDQSLEAYRELFTNSDNVEWAI